MPESGQLVPKVGKRLAYARRVFDFDAVLHQTGERESHRDSVVVERSDSRGLDRPAWIDNQVIRPLTAFHTETPETVVRRVNSIALFDAQIRYVRDSAPTFGERRDCSEGQHGIWHVFHIDINAVQRSTGERNLAFQI